VELKIADDIACALLGGESFRQTEPHVT
jgi:hypothetical protein